MSRHDNIIVTYLHTILINNIIIIRVHYEYVTSVVITSYWFRFVCNRNVLLSPKQWDIIYYNIRTKWRIVKYDKSKRNPNFFGRILSNRLKLNVKLFADETRLYYNHYCHVGMRRYCETA